MDDPGLDEAAHLHALGGLRQINRVSFAADSLFEPIWQLAQRRNLNHLRLIDIACGGGDVATDLTSQLLKRGLTVELTLLDRSPVVLKQASRIAHAAGIQPQLICQDALAPLPENHYDIVVNSLFLHHLRKDQVILFLRNARQAARHAVIISDLARSRLGWILAWVGCRILSRSRIVHYDGPVSVQGAWTAVELFEMANQAQMSGIRIAFRWPCRLLFEWNRHGAT